MYSFNQIQSIGNVFTLSNRQSSRKILQVKTYREIPLIMHHKSYVYARIYFCCCCCSDCCRQDAACRTMKNESFSCSRRNKNTHTLSLCSHDHRQHWSERKKKKKKKREKEEEATRRRRDEFLRRKKRAQRSS